MGPNCDDRLLLWAFVKIDSETCRIDNQYTKLLYIYIYYTCTGVAAMSIPDTPPPRTRPSDPARDTLSPPLVLLWSLLSLSTYTNAPDREIISYRP